MATNFLPFRWSRNELTEAADFKLRPNCFAWMVINISPVGGPVVFVDGWPLNPPLAAGANGEFTGVSGPFGAVIPSNDAPLEIRFSGPGGRCFIRQLYYVCDGS